VTRVRNLLVGICAALIAMPAVAEPPIGSRIGNRLSPAVQKNSEEEMARSAHAAAACMANKRGHAVARLLAASDEAELQKAQKAIWANNLTCYSGFSDNEIVEGRRIDWPTDLMRGMLAEEMLKSRTRDVAELAALPLRQGRYVRSWFAMTGRNPVIDEMGACLADTSPSQIGAILAVRPYSAEENSSFGAIIPMMGNCLSAGAKLTGNRQSLRAAFADALYQRLINPGASNWSSEAAK
jgi:hypothetical protein